MKLDKEHWKELDINVDSLWLIGPRAKGGKHSNAYHGNFAPQIPNNMIRRYTDEGDVVLEMFTGSGTTLFECETLRRNYIGFDINEEIIQFVNDRMVGCKDITYNIHNCDITDTAAVEANISNDLENLGKRSVDLVISHPPYMDIVKFTDRPEDMSSITDLSQFINIYIKAVGNCFHYLKSNKYFVLVIGDIYRNSEVIPLGFYLMYAIRKNFPCILKGVVVKDMVGNRAKIGLENLWRYRALQNGNYLFKHEYIFVFKKTRR